MKYPLLIVFLLIGCDSDSEYASSLASDKYSELTRCEQLPSRREPSFNEFDIGERITDFETPSVWNATYLFLSDTCYKVSAGTISVNNESKPSIFAFDVEMKTDSGWLVIFSREILTSELPIEFTIPSISNLVFFNDSENIVTFTLANEIYTYKLPAP
ncbi:hypothetical protein OAP18_01280 [Gammaproteobacteria bacterium]|nr:hypothetical protein [Gammaproteobacteria bacterium]